VPSLRKRQVSVVLAIVAQGWVSTVQIVFCMSIREDSVGSRVETSHVGSRRPIYIDA
jgi:hypothetical protein